MRKGLLQFKLHGAGAEDPRGELVGEGKSLASFQSLTSGWASAGHGTRENGEHRCICICVCMGGGGVVSMSTGVCTAVLACEGAC